MLKKTYIVFWTYMANYAQQSYRTEAYHPFSAIMQTVGTLYMTQKGVRYLVFEVGGDQVFHGTLQEAVLELGLPPTDDGEFYQRELEKEGYKEVPDVASAEKHIYECSRSDRSTRICDGCPDMGRCYDTQIVTLQEVPRS